MRLAASSTGFSFRTRGGGKGWKVVSARPPWPCLDYGTAESKEENVLAPRDSFLLRIDPIVMASLRSWAADELRSVNGQIEFLLRKALRDAGRLDPSDETAEGGPRKKRQKKEAVMRRGQIFGLG